MPARSLQAAAVVAAALAAGLWLARAIVPHLDSDALVYALLHRDLGTYDLGEFSLPRVTGAFPEVPLLMAALALAPDVPAAYGAYALALLALFGLAAAAVARALRKPAMIGAAYAALLAALLFGGRPTLLLLMPGYHGGASVDGLLLLAAALARRPGPTFAAGFVGVLSDPLFLAQYLAPAALATRLPKPAALAAAAALATWFLASRWLHFQDLGFNLRSLPGEILPGLQAFTHDAGRLALAHPAPALLLLATLALAAKRRDDLDRAVLLSLLLTLAAAALGGRWRDLDSARYLLPCLVLPPLYLLLRLPVNPLALAAVAALQVALAGPPPPLGEFVPCLDRLATAKGLRYGLGDFNAANQATMLSTTGVRVNHLAPDLRLWHWGNNLQAYDRTPEGAFPEYRFVIAHGLDRERLLEELGAPSETHWCDGAEVMIYPPETLRGFLRRKLDEHAHPGGRGD